MSSDSADRTLAILFTAKTGKRRTDDVLCKGVVKGEHLAFLDVAFGREGEVLGVECKRGIARVVSHCDRVTDGIEVVTLSNMNCMSVIHSHDGKV